MRDTRVVIKESLTLLVLMNKSTKGLVWVVLKAKLMPHWEMTVKRRIQNIVCVHVLGLEDVGWL